MGRSCLFFLGRFTTRQKYTVASRYGSLISLRILGRTPIKIGKATRYGSLISFIFGNDSYKANVYSSIKIWVAHIFKYWGGPPYEQEKLLDMGRSYLLFLGMIPTKAKYIVALRYGSLISLKNREDSHKK